MATDKETFVSELASLRSKGVTLPNHPYRAAQAYWSGVQENQKVGTYLAQTSTPSHSLIADDPEVARIVAHNQAMMNAMASSRGLSRSGMSHSSAARRTAQDQRWGLTKTSMLGGAGSPLGGDVYNAIPRFYDPLEYWDLSGLPWNVADEGHRHKLHKWLRLYYATHYLVPVLVDIFTRFPLVGLELSCKDPALVEIYEDIFLDQLHYEDFLVSLGREYWLCLPAGEPILTQDGVSDIETIATGDVVLTHQGRYQEVISTHSSWYQGDMYALRPHYGPTMRTTKGHRFWYKSHPDAAPRWTPIEDMTQEGYVYAPIRPASPEGKPTISLWESMSRDEWDVCDPYAHYEECPSTVGWTQSPNKYSGLPTEFDLDEDLLWLMGLFVAEGGVSNGGSSNVKDKRDGDVNQTSWSLNLQSESHLGERVRRIVADKFNLSSSVIEYPDANGLVIQVYNIPLAHWFVSLFGRETRHKHFPAWAFTLTRPQIAALLRGYYDGDGDHPGHTQSTRRLKAVTTSRRLAYQVSSLIQQLGFVSQLSDPLVTHNAKCANDTTQWLVGPVPAQTTAFGKLLGYDVTGWHHAEDALPLFALADEGGYWVKIFRLDSYPYEGNVYNITTEGDHSFVSSVAVHNCGEAFPLGHFDEDLGIWENEELLNPEDIVIDNFPLLDTQQLKIVPPDYLKRIAQTKSPAREWYMLQQNYEELIPYLLKGEHIPISPVMLTQVANKLNDWDDHGTPILLRGLRTLLHEERLMASQDAIAERLYSPFILAKLGIMDMGDGLPPWIPTPDELQSVRDDIDIAMASDFRVMVHHFGLDMTSVFGREQMPRLGDDFDRIERRLMMVFGINPSLLSAGTNSQPYASSALQAEFMNQILRTFQQTLKNHFAFRAAVVAEAQGHYDYESKGQTRVPIYETVVDWDDEGNKLISQRHKLLYPDINFKTFDLRDEATERQFLMGLRQAGLPIPDEKLMLGIDWKNDDYIDIYNADIMKKTIAQQRAKMNTYLALVTQGLPVPADLKAEVESVLNGDTGPTMPPGQGGPAGPSGPGGGPPGGPGGGPPSGPGGAEGMMGAQMPSPPPGLSLGPDDSNMPPGGGAPPIGPRSTTPGNVPEVSNERRQGLTYNVSSVVEKESSEADIIEDTEDGNDPDTWVLKSNQHIAKINEQNVILETTKRHSLMLGAPNKRYSIIDSLSELNDTDDESSGQSEDPTADN